jgi:hypothetical protein
MRKLPAITLGFVLATAAVAVMAKSASTTTAVLPVHAQTISVDEMHKSINLAALPHSSNHDMF